MNATIRKIGKIFLNAIPVIVMIGLIPIVRNDYALAAVDIIIIIVSLFIKRETGDFFFLGFGFFVMIISETFFIKTGAEMFTGITLFSIMPIWLPILWGYGFVVIKRGIVILSV